MVGIVKSTHSKAQIMKHFIMHLCSAHFINITLFYNSRYTAVRFAIVRNYLSLLSMCCGSCPCILCLNLIHRTHFSNLSAEIIRTCSVLLFKSPGIDHIPAELRQEVEQFAMRSIKLLFLFGIRRICLRGGRSRTLYRSKRAIKRNLVIIGAYHFCQLLTIFYPTSCCQG
jgi:hypothetical protein